MPERFLKQFYGMASWPLGSFQCLGLSSLNTFLIAQLEELMPLALVVSPSRT